MKTTTVLLAAVTLSCVVGMGGVCASAVAAETQTSPATASEPSATNAAPVATNAAAATGRAAAPAATPDSGGLSATAPAAAASQSSTRTDGTPTVPADVPNPPARVRAKITRFTLSSSTWKTGASAPKIRVRIAASKATAARVQVRIEDRRSKLVTRQSLGTVRSGVDVTTSVTKRLAAQPGSYRLKLVVRDATGRKSQAKPRALRVAASAPAAPATPAPPAESAAPSSAAGGYVFPVQGACNFRSLSSQRFHAGRDGGRQHNGQDIGTFSSFPPVVAVTTGTVERVWYDSMGGGWTVVYNGDDKVAYGYLHLKPGTITVAAGQRVTPGQQIANAGQSGGHYDPHLHFEMRPIPWDQNRETAIDPMPFLQKLPNQCEG